MALARRRLGAPSESMLFIDDEAGRRILPQPPCALRVAAA
jgi:hypothetical protein